VALPAVRRAVGTDSATLTTAAARELPAHPCRRAPRSASCMPATTRTGSIARSFLGTVAFALTPAASMPRPHGTHFGEIPVIRQRTRLPASIRRLYPRHRVTPQPAAGAGRTASIQGPGGREASARSRGSQGEPPPIVAKPVRPTSPRPARSTGCSWLQERCDDPSSRVRE